VTNCARPQMHQDYRASQPSRSSNKCRDLSSYNRHSGKEGQQCPAGNCIHIRKKTPTYSETITHLKHWTPGCLTIEKRVWCQRTRRHVLLPLTRLVRIVEHSSAIAIRSFRVTVRSARGLYQERMDRMDIVHLAGSNVVI
jgi:hypothetical protein